MAGAPRPVSPGRGRAPAPEMVTPIYSGNQYRRDAAFIVIMREEYDAAEHLAIIDEVFYRAKGVQALTSTETWQQFLENARARMQDENSIRSQAEAEAFVAQFIRGPTQESTATRQDPALKKNQQRRPLGKEPQQ